MTNYTSLISLVRRWYLDGMDTKIKLFSYNNMANLRDLLTVTGLVILLKLDSNHRFFSQCDLEIWWMISKNNRALLLYYIKLCASFQIHRWIQNGVKSPETLNLGRNWRYFVLCDLEVWWMTLKNNRAPLLYYIKLCALFQSHGWIQTGVTVQKRSIRVKIGNFLSHETLKFDGWPWKKKVTSSKQHQALCIISSAYVNSNWSYGSERAKWVHDLCDLDLWPWPFAWTSRCQW